MATSNWVKSMLTQRGVPYEELHHRVAFTAQEVAQSEHVSGHFLAKVVIVLADGRPVELILPASRRVVLGLVRELLGTADIRLASEAEISNTFTDCEPGAIPPLRHWKDVLVLMDASMASTGDLVFQAGTHEDVIRLKFQDWFRLVGPLVGSFTEPEHAAHRGTFADREDVGSEDWEGSAEALEEEARRESGLPGGGKGRLEVVKLSGIYPGSGPYPEGNAEVRTPGQFVHGQVDEQGREVEGGSGLMYMGEGVLLGGETPAPGGSPGGQRRRSMTARELMTQPVVTVRRETCLADVARTMVDHSVGCVPVVDKKGKLCGIITQSDFDDNQKGAPYSIEGLLQMFAQVSPSETTERAREEARATTANEVMHTEVFTGVEDTPVEEMARQMLRYDIDHIPVLRDGVPVGMVARHDFLRLIAEAKSL